MGEPRRIAILLRHLSTALLAVYVVCVVVDNLPVKLLEPAWIFTFASTLVNYVTIPLAAYGFLHLAFHLSPSSRLEADLVRIGKMAQVAAVGFVLLLPLLFYSGYSNSQQIINANQRQKHLAQLSAARLLRAINGSVTPQQLQERMIALQGPRISDDALRFPLSTLQREARRSLRQAQASIEVQLKSPFSADFLPLYRQFLRTALLAVVSALGFVALAWWPGKKNSLLPGFFDEELPFGPARLRRLFLLGLRLVHRSFKGCSRRLASWQRRHRAHASQKRHRHERQQGLKRPGNHGRQSRLETESPPQRKPEP